MARPAELEMRLQVASRRRAHELCAETAKMSAGAAGLGSFPAVLQGADAQTMAEQLIDAYLDGAERSDNAASVEVLQALAARAISRLAWLRALSVMDF